MACTIGRHFNQGRIGCALRRIDGCRQGLSAVERAKPYPVDFGTGLTISFGIAASS